MRGRAGGVTRTQGSVPAEGMNMAEISSTGVKVDTLRNLMKLSAQCEKDTTEGDTAAASDDSSPPKLISLDQVIMRGEDLTGKEFVCGCEHVCACYAIGTRACICTMYSYGPVNSVVLANQLAKLIRFYWTLCS